MYLIFKYEALGADIIHSVIFMIQPTADNNQLVQMLKRSEAKLGLKYAIIAHLKVSD